MSTRTPATDPSRVVASFDSATVLHGALAAALRGQDFPHLGNSPLAAAAIRVGGRLPWTVLRRLYTRIGASEGIAPDALGAIDMTAVAGWLADELPRRRYPAAFVGSSNGALAHLAAAMQAPWLPGTVLVPVSRTGDPWRLDEACAFGRRHAPAFLDANPEVTLHHMHDPVQDELMASRMAYFRTKWRRLPEPYARFLRDNLLPGAPVVVVEDRSRWPVVHVADRHVFQPGAQGGVGPEHYLRAPHTPTPDGEAPEAEWGADPGLADDLARWCAAHHHPLVRLSFDGPQAPAHPVATVLRDWYRARGEPADRLVVPSFVLGDPWRTLASASVPFWTFFSVQPAVEALRDHLAASEPYGEVHVLLFEHGVDSTGIARPTDWVDVIRSAGARPHLLGLDRRRFPHDIGLMGRYGRAMSVLPTASAPWTPLDAETALRLPGLDHGTV